MLNPIKRMSKLNRRELQCVIAGFALGIFSFVIFIIGVMLWSDYNDHTGTSITSKCPDDYGTDDAASATYLAATNKWTNDFYDTHPDATLTDWAVARQQFWVDNNCTASLQRYDEYKNNNPYAPVY